MCWRIIARLFWKSHRGQGNDRGVHRMISSRAEAGPVPVEEEDEAALDDRRVLALRIAAWGVHLYTAIGLVLAARMAMLLVRGGAEAFREVFVLMLVATPGGRHRRDARPQGRRSRRSCPGSTAGSSTTSSTSSPTPSSPCCWSGGPGSCPKGPKPWLLFPCSPAPMGSARSRPRPTTAISWASPRSGTWWRFTSTSSTCPAGWPSRSWWSSA